jgi:purine-cytosine permease-like protein
MPSLVCFFLSRLPFADTSLYTGTCLFSFFSSVNFFSDRFEKYVWIPNVIAFPILLGVAARHLNPSTFPEVPPSSAAQIISFGSVVASVNISWGTVTPDCGVYHDAEAST